MNVGIVTPYDSNNYGAFLQAYALKRHLENAGHQIHHIRFRSAVSARRLFYCMRPGRHGVLHPVEHVRQAAFGREKMSRFTEDAAVFDVIEPTAVGGLDAVILGSDEIWNVRHEVFRDPLFYGHGMRNAIAYAPSIGAATADDFALLSDRVADIQRLAAIMVRDARTADFIATVRASRPPVVVDPTILHEWSDSLPGCSDKYLAENKYLLVYAYGSKHLPVEEIREYATSHGLRTVSVGFRHAWCDRSVNCSPLSFIDVVDRAECVVTTTFHGTIFAVLRRRRFASNPTSPKTSDLLASTGLQSAMLGGPGAGDRNLESALECDFDFTRVADVIDERRSESRELLAEALESVSASAQRVLQ